LDIIKKIEDSAKILGLGYYASIEEIKKRYREIAKEVHPDVNSNDNTDFIKLKEAYETLINYCYNFKIPLTSEEIKKARNSVEHMFDSFFDKWWFNL